MTLEERLYFQCIAQANICANCGHDDITIKLITFNKGSNNEKSEFWCDRCEEDL